MNSFSCTHCGKSFQAETPEPKECPHCFWSSSISKINLGEESKLNVKTSKPTAPTVKEWIIIAGVIAICLVIVSLAMYFFPASFSKAPSTPITPSESPWNTVLMIALGLLGLIWMGLQKIWPFLLFGFLAIWVQWIIKDAVRDGVRDALSDYSVQEELKETIREAIKSPNENDWDDD